MDAAASFLAVRARSVSETTSRLRHLGYPQALVDQVVARLIDMSYLDDAAFARAWVESRDRANPRGESALRRELTLKGVARPLVEEILAERDVGQAAGDSDRGAAFALLERRRSALEREQDARKTRVKAYALLARNGFDPEICRDVSRTFADGVGSSDEDE